MEKKIENALREKWAKNVCEWLDNIGEEPIWTAAGSLYIPTLDENGDDAWVEIKIIVHPNANEEDGTDGYSLGNTYKAKLQKRADSKARATEKKKAKKDGET